MTKTKYFQNCLGVFQGGGCKASAYVGAFREATNWGVSFSELVGTSAGSIIAVFVAAGATPDDLEEIINDLDFKNFLIEPSIIPGYNAPRRSNLLKYTPSKTIRKYSPIITHLGLHNSNELRNWVDKKLAKLLPNKPTPIKFKDLIIPVHVIVSDIKTKKIEIFGQRESANMDVAEAVQFSCNIPLFFQPINLRYVDGGMLSNLPSFIFSEDNSKFYNKILAFSLESKETNKEIADLWDYGRALLDTVIDGNLDLQLSLQENVHIIRIDTGDIKATDFDKIDADRISFLKENGAKAVKKFFINEISNLRNSRKRPDVLLDSFQTYNKITQLLEKKYEEIIIIDDGNIWVYEIFPTLLKWFYDKTNILFICKKPVVPDKHFEFRNRILEHAGVQINYEDHIPFKGFVFDGKSNQYCRAIILSENSHFHSKFYEGETDFHVINLIRKLYEDRFSTRPLVKFSIEAVDNEVLIKELRNVRQYNSTNVKISLQKLNIQELTFITKFIRAYKYRQIESLFNLFSKSGVGYFETSRLTYNFDKYTLITPPVIEKIGDEYYVIEGNTRLIYAHKNGIKELKCIVVEGVSETLPSDGRYSIKEVILSDKEVIGEERYDNFDYTNFRKIESSVRDPKKCLI